MSVSQMIQVVQNAMLLVLKVSAPILLASMAVGLLISILQAATQIHEQTVVFVPKLVAIVLVLVVMGSWMADTMRDFVNSIFRLIAGLN
mgnify:CR=1 FL=1